MAKGRVAAGQGDFAKGLKILLDGEPLTLVHLRTGLPLAWLRRVASKGLGEKLDSRSAGYVKRLHDYLGWNCWAVGRGAKRRLPTWAAYMLATETSEEKMLGLVRLAVLYKKARARIYADVMNKPADKRAEAIAEEAFRMAGQNYRQWRNSTEHQRNVWARVAGEIDVPLGLLRKSSDS